MMVNITIYGATPQMFGTNLRPYNTYAHHTELGSIVFISSCNKYIFPFMIETMLSTYLRSIRYIYFAGDNIS